MCRSLFHHIDHLIEEIGESDDIQMAEQKFAERLEQCRSSAKVVYA
jgi:hypothetical protein